MRSEKRPGDENYRMPRESIFTFDLESKKVRQYGTKLASQGIKLPRKLLCVYEERGKVDGHGIYSNWSDLLSSSPNKVTLTHANGAFHESFYGNARSACRLGKSLYFVNNNGLHEMQLDGTIRRSWESQFHYREMSPLTHRFYQPNVNAPPQIPLPWYSSLLACDETLLMFSGKGNRVLALDTEQNIWYGPVEISGVFCGIADGDYVLAGGKSLMRISVAEITAAAKRCDRAMTNQQFIARQNKIIEAMSGLERAKIEFSLKRFDDSKKHLLEVLTQQPNDAETLLMLGLVHDTWGLNDVKTASGFYQQAELVSSDRSWGLAAADLRIDMLFRAGDLNESAKAATKLLKNYPDISNSYRQRMQVKAGPQR